MYVETVVSVPKLIYDIYLEAATELGNCSVEQVMSSALHAYAKFLFDEMMANGELTEHIEK